MREPVYFLRLEIENYRCFKERQVLDLSDGNGNWRKWTVILGDNGTGKSSLLELLAAAETEELLDDNVKGYYPKGMIFARRPSVINTKDQPGQCLIGLNIHWNDNHTFDGFIKYGFDRDLQKSWSVYGHQDARLEGLKCFGYGASRKMDDGSLSTDLGRNSETLFYEDFPLINVEAWLLQLDYAASKGSDIQDFAIRKRDRVKQMLIDLLPGINDIRFTIPTIEKLRSTVEFQTPFGWVAIHQLSMGYRTMVAWMVDLAARMFDRYPDSDNPLAEPAIVLVDEIDLHLHPKWQRKIFDYLSDRFPQTQFIVTAHSPLVVQSAPQDANIVLLRREGDHVVIDNEIASVQNWRLDQILTSDLFGVDSARGSEAAKKLEERKALLAKKSLSKKEKERLDELNAFTDKLPTAYNPEDIEAMSIVQEAAAQYKKQKK